MLPTPGEARQPWDRRRGELPKDFADFVKYRDLGPARSLSKLAREADRGMTRLSMLCRLHDWVDRAAAWDDYMDRERQLAQVEELRAMHRRHATLANAMFVKAGQRIQSIEPEKLTVREAVMLADLAVRIERHARGEPIPSIDVRADLTHTFLPSGSKVIQAIRTSPQILDLIDAIDDTLANDTPYGTKPTALPPPS